MTSRESMRSIGQALRKERTHAGWTAANLAKALGCSKGQLSLMESGQRTISVERALAVEKILKIRDGRLVEAVRWHNAPPEIRQTLARLMHERQEMTLGVERAVASHDPRQSHKRLVKLSRGISKAAAQVPLPLRQLHTIPLINTVAAGYPREFTGLDYPASVAEEYIACPDVNDRDAFAVRVIGDSMEPEYREGDIVVFSPVLKTPAGSDCFVRLNRGNETTFKRVYFDDDKRTIRLQPLNNAYPPRLVDRTEVVGMHAAVSVTRRVKHGANA